MHIEPGIIDPVRVLGANIVALGVVSTQAKAIVKKPLILAKALLAAALFTITMESWHMPVGPSELHLICATTVYLLFGFEATLIGFAGGLAFQTLIEPQDTVNLGVNALSLMLPLIAMHKTFGQKLSALGTAEKFTFARVARLDAVYYAGVSLMVLFWLAISNQPLPFVAWGKWAVAYLPVFAAEALITYTSVSLIAKFKETSFVQKFFEISKLNFAK